MSPEFVKVPAIVDQVLGFAQAGIQAIGQQRRLLLPRHASTSGMLFSTIRHGNSNAIGITPGPLLSSSESVARFPSPGARLPQRNRSGNPPFPGGLSHAERIRQDQGTVCPYQQRVLAAQRKGSNGFVLDILAKKSKPELHGTSNNSPGSSPICASNVQVRTSHLRGRCAPTLVLY